MTAETALTPAALPAGLDAVILRFALRSEPRAAARQLGVLTAISATGSRRIGLTALRADDPEREAASRCRNLLRDPAQRADLLGDPLTGGGTRGNELEEK